MSAPLGTSLLWRRVSQPKHDITRKYDCCIVSLINLSSNIARAFSHLRLVIMVAYHDGWSIWWSHRTVRSDWAWSRWEGRSLVAFLSWNMTRLMRLRSHAVSCRFSASKTLVSARHHHRFASFERMPLVSVYTAPRDIGCSDKNPEGFSRCLRHHARLESEKISRKRGSPKVSKSEE